MSKKEENTEKFLTWISAAYADEEVKKDSELKTALLGFAKELDKDHNINLVRNRMCYFIEQYAFSHHNSMPAALGVLYKKITDRTNLDMMIASSFGRAGM